MAIFKAIIFDMDGVIVDSEPIHERAFMELFSQIGFTGGTEIDFSAYFGRSDRTLLIDLLAQHPLPLSLEDLARRKQAIFLEILTRERPIFPAIRPLVAQLHPRHRLAVASGSNRTVINAVLDMGRLHPYFSALVSAHEVARGKPAPDVFLRAASLLQVPPGECCVIEDAAFGVDAALAAGMKVIAITNSLPADKLSHATWVVETYDQIERLLEG